MSKFNRPITITLPSHLPRALPVDSLRGVAALQEHCGVTEPIEVTVKHGGWEQKLKVSRVGDSTVIEKG